MIYQQLFIILNLHNKTDILLKDSDDATFYYNVKKEDICSKTMNILHYPELDGVPLCETYNYVRHIIQIKNKTNNHYM